ncbi:MAG: GNAT family N-acetyltransferase [Rhodospirillaceae bacterium]|nr:GNAT family N-acetyltransferase [Rhodospirillaceae bacterium]
MDGAMPPRIETERLLLRPPEPADYEPWAAFMADAEVQHFLGGVQPRPIAWRGLCTMAGAWSLFGFGMFSVIEKATGRWIGRLGPWYPEGWPAPEVGWALVRAAWGKGYATEGAAAAMDWAFAELGWTEIVHCIVPENRPSQRVAERLGSTFLRPGHLPAPINLDTDLWGQSRNTWLDRKRGQTPFRRKGV